jgi:hypothetical protein
MDKEIGKIKKNETTDIVVRVDEYNGKKGLTIREYITSERYTGFSKAGTRIPAESFLAFREMINLINAEDLLTEPVLKLEEEPKPKEKKAKKPKAEKALPEKPIEEKEISDEDLL